MLHTITQIPSNTYILHVVSNSCDIPQIIRFAVCQDLPLAKHWLQYLYQKAPCCWATWVCEYHQSSTEKVDDSCDWTKLGSQHCNWTFPADTSVTLPIKEGNPEKSRKKSEAEGYAASQPSPGIWMEHFGLLGFLRPAKTWRAVDGRDPARVKVGIVYPHYFQWDLNSIIRCCQFHHIAHVWRPPHLEPTVIWIGNLTHILQASDWKIMQKLWDHLPCIQYQGGSYAYKRSQYLQ